MLSVHQTVNRDRTLAATAAATTAFAFVAIAVVIEHCQFIHGFHLLSFHIEVCLYIEEKNIDLGNGLE